MKIVAIAATVILLPAVVYFLSAISARAKLTVFEESAIGQLIAAMLDDRVLSISIERHDKEEL